GNASRVVAEREDYLRLDRRDSDAASRAGGEVRQRSRLGGNGGDGERIHDAFDHDHGCGGRELVMAGSIEEPRLIERRSSRGVAVLRGSGVTGDVAADEAFDAPVWVACGNDDSAPVRVGPQV